MLELIFMLTCICENLLCTRGLPRWCSGKESEAQETQVRSLGREDPLEKEMATHFSFLAWEILWTEEPGGLQSVGSHPKEWDTTEHTHTHTRTHTHCALGAKKSVSAPFLHYSLSFSFKFCFIISAYIWFYTMAFLLHQIVLKAGSSYLCWV